MSLNLCLSASVDVIQKLSHKNLETRQVEEYRFLWSTPTVVTEKLLGQPDVLKGYCEWAKECDPEDYRQHIEQLLDWISEHDGWQIQWGME